MRREEVKKKDWYSKLYGCASYRPGLSCSAIKITKHFQAYQSAYECINNNVKYTKAFAGKIDLLQDVIDSVTPTENVANCIDFSKILAKLPQSDLCKLLAASIPNIDADSTAIDQYQKLTKLYLKDDKEHNQNQQVPECDS